MNYHHGNLRRELLDRAAQVIAKQGIENLSLRGLAQDLGVSHGAPARHFKDKLDLLRALATEGHNKLAAYADQELRAASRRRMEMTAAAARQAQAAGWLEGESVEDAVTFSLAAVRGVAALLSDPLYLM